MDTTIIRTDAEIRNFLEQKTDGETIAAEVAQEALSHSYEQLAEFFDDLLRNGCVSGMI